MIKILVLDFDGVVTPRSEFFKQEAWRDVFSSYGKRAEKPFLEAEKKYGGGRGGDRFDILQETYKLLGEPSDKIAELVKLGSEIFDKYVQKKILEAGINSNSKKTLESLSHKVPIYLNSATPVESLARSVKALGIESCFKASLGSPKSKVENFKYVSQKENTTPQEILFVGDGDSDYRAALEFGCKFIGFANDWNKWDKKSFPLIRNLNEIGKYL